MRQTVVYTVKDEGRDKGKVFIITEWPASQAERWAMRAFMALGRNGVDLPEGVKNSGLVATDLALLCRIPFEEAETLLAEMFSCVQVQPSPGVVRALIEEDIEEVATRIKLRLEVFKLHTGFSPAAA
ncbi:MAG: hypothetical protein KGH75_02665 [Rhodospirillales bacterium]|nr:hypothetical protein [Rhodospirillales bacterium]